MFLGGWRKLEDPDEIHRDTRTQVRQALDQTQNAGAVTRQHYLPKQNLPQE